MRMIRIVVGTAALAAAAVVPAQEPTPPRPTAISAAVVPIAFDDEPVVRTAVGHDQPFVEGHLRYGYGGRVTTDVRSGKRVVVPAGSPAYGVPMSIGGAGPELVWCAIPTPAKPGLTDVCLTGSTLSGSANDSLLTTGLYVPRYGQPFTGGAIEPARFDLGAPIRVAYYVQNLGKITRIKGEAWVGDVKVNQWGIVWGTILRGGGEDEKLIRIGGGLVGVRPDPAAKGRYLVRTIAPPHAGGSAILEEMRIAAAPGR